MSGLWYLDYIYPSSILEQCTVTYKVIEMGGEEFGKSNRILCWSLRLVWMMNVRWKHTKALHWRHNERDGVSNHQPHDFLLNRLFRRRSNETSKLRATGLCEGIHRWPVNSPHKGRKMFPFNEVIMIRHSMNLRSAMSVVTSTLLGMKREASGQQPTSRDRYPLFLYRTPDVGIGHQ